MPDRVFWALCISGVLLSTLIWPAIAAVHDWLESRGCVDLGFDDEAVR